MIHCTPRASIHAFAFPLVPIITLLVGHACVYISSSSNSVGVRVCFYVCVCAYLLQVPNDNRGVSVKTNSCRGYLLLDLPPGTRCRSQWVHRTCIYFHGYCMPNAKITSCTLELERTCARGHKCSTRLRVKEIDVIFFPYPQCIAYHYVLIDCYYRDIINILAYKNYIYIYIYWSFLYEAHLQIMQSSSKRNYAKKHCMIIYRLPYFLSFIILYFNIPS